MTKRQHLWLALSPHGYGHAVMTAPVIAELRRRRPLLRLTIQTSIPREFLVTRYGEDFTHVDQISDFGFRMHSATDIDFDASAQGYDQLHGEWESVVAEEGARLGQGRPDLILANIPYVTLAAAAQVGIRSVALSSLNWCDLYAHYLGNSPGAAEVLAQMRHAHSQAEVFLRCTPAMPMSLPNVRDIGPCAKLGTRRRDDLHMGLGVSGDQNIGLIAFGGIDHAMNLEKWPVIPGWVWLSTLPVPKNRPDLRSWRESGLHFEDLIPSVDVLVGKPGYGTYTEAGLAGTPMITIPRSDWPETEPFNTWLSRHTRWAEVHTDDLLSSHLPEIIVDLLAQPKRPPAMPTGSTEAAQILEEDLDACE